MTARTPQPDEFDLLLTAWLDADAQVREPEHLLAGVLTRTARARPLPAWRLSERWLPMQLALRAQPRVRLVPLLVALALLVAALVAVGLIAGSRRHVPQPFGLAKNGQIAFINDGKLVTENADGSSSVTLLPDSHGQPDARFSRDGTKLVYLDLLGTSTAPSPARLQDVVVADADGSHASVVAHSVAAVGPMWSPDGRWLSYTLIGDGRAFVVPADGSRPPTDLGFFSAGGTPSWSPDSVRLAVAADDRDLWLVNRDGTNAHRISHGDYARVGERGSNADWSPDGTRLLFGAVGAGEPNDIQDTGLYVIGQDGASERLISPCANNGVWSPDGSMLAYVRCGTGVGPSLVVADANGRQIRVLDGYYGWYIPVWSPDQTRIAILDDRPGPANEPGPPVIVLLDPLGKEPPITLPAGNTTLTDDTGPDVTLTWQRLAP